MRYVKLSVVLNTTELTYGGSPVLPVLSSHMTYATRERLAPLPTARLE